MFAMFIFEYDVFFILLVKTLFIFIFSILFLNFYLLILNHFYESIFILFIRLISLFSWYTSLITAVIYLVLFFKFWIEISHFHCFPLKILALRKLIENGFITIFIWWNHSRCSIFTYWIKLLSEITF